MRTKSPCTRETFFYLRVWTLYKENRPSLIRAGTNPVQCDYIFNRDARWIDLAHGTEQDTHRHTITRFRVVDSVALAGDFVPQTHMSKSKISNYRCYMAKRLF